jgi:hypothetical protein
MGLISQSRGEATGSTVGFSVIRIRNFSRHCCVYRGAYKSLDRPTSRCILFDGENISFDASLVIYINSTNIPPIVIINRIYEHQNLLSL